MAEIVYVEKKSNLGLIIFGAIVLLGGLFGLAWYINRKEVPALELENNPAETPPGEVTPAGTPASSSYGLVNGAQNILTTMVNLVSEDSSLFPLVRQTGAALHISNPLVKDVQQYLNKFAGKNLDVDGAFGGATEAAVQQVFGTKTVTLDQYNMMAEKLGKQKLT